MRRRDGTDQIRAEAAWERTRFSHPIDRAIHPSINTHHQQSIDDNHATSFDNHPIPNTTVSGKNKFDNQSLTPDEFVKTPQTISRRINDPGIIAACHCGAEYETEYSASIETHTTTSIDSGHQKLTDIPHDESVDSRPDDWENDYYNPAIAAYTRQHMHT
ncbi:hypothetical protein F2Q69_00042124 [Brassica cretica]|uniref:Uncharacterized protein n=1 Tax=Brassica cretica TaxID=69181 RepID=A0A8S9NAQ2_BRACR|nr:hypothetical protein F2Q69_00042124 [Brassica cretica]